MSNISRRYVLAILVVILTVSASHFFSRLALSAQDGTAEAINVSGRQRMLSQRIQLAAIRYADSSGTSRDAQAMLRDAIAHFLAAHDGLTSGLNAAKSSDEDLIAHYDRGASGGLDQQSRDFAALAQLVLEAAPSETHAARAAFHDYDAEGLLEGLNTAVTLYEDKAIRLTKQALRLGTLSYVVALIVLFLEMIFIFLPILRVLRTNNLELERQNTALRKARAEAEFQAERAQDASVAKSQFLANMSHEIRTPMNGIIGMSELLRETRLTREQESFAKTIAQSGNALLGIINDVLDFSKAEALKIELVHEAFDLHETVFSVVKLLSPKAAEKSIDLCVDYPDDLGRGFVRDAARLRQVLINIVGNAIKFTDVGFVAIGIALDADGVTVTVQDSGIGIAADKQASIFTAFEQVDGAATREFEGTGLGLAISQKLVHLMGGQIDLHSVLNAGSRFEIRLPLAQTGEVKQSSPDVSVRHFKGLRALIVDDVFVNRRILELRLAGWGFETVVVDSAEAALKEITARGPQGFDVGIIDYQMPKTTGLDLAVQLKAKNSVDFPLILFTSVDQHWSAKQLAESGFATSLTKPAKSEELQSCLSKVLDVVVSKTSDTRHPSTPGGVMFNGARILVVDDNKTNRFVMQKMLERYGAKLETCCNGEEAVAARAVAEFDMIFMDISMPVMNGLDASRAIRALERDQALPRTTIVALTAAAQPSMRRDCAAAQMDGYLAKPVRKADIEQVLHQFLGAARAS